MSVWYEPQAYKDIVYLLPYPQPAVQVAIKHNKYQGSNDAARTLAAVLDQYFKRFDTITIVTVPQSYTRWRERGFDHLEEILKHSQYRDSLQTDVLQKTTHTKRQAHVSKTKRLKQQAGTYTCQPVAASLSGTVILFDDVITTGSTMQAARSALQQHLPRDTRLVCVALAH